MSDPTHWNDRYLQGDTPWETGHPSTELQLVVQEECLAPCRALDLGCGTGANAVWLAQQGFAVVGVDVSPAAVERARRRAEEAGVAVQFVAADLLDLPALGV